MIKVDANSGKRPLLTKQLDCDLAIVGGGLAGVCCAVTAARAGLKVTLIQDRPLLGGNASSEVRLWILGATSHMGNNNRWAREGGVIDEILVENMYRNPEGNPLMVDALLLEKVISEPNITLLLNTAVHDLEKSDPDTIKMVRAFCAQNSTTYEVTAPLFCDASGDGVVGFLAGAAFRVGAEGRDEFDEAFAPVKPTNQLLGHSIYFYSKDTGRPVKFTAPSFALQDITKIPRYRDFKANDYGCRLWWIEYGGLLDTVHATEEIKWELWKVAYGVWNYIKNSGNFPEAENLTLEWVGTIPGKRESRRFEGDYMVSQRDLVEQRLQDDAVSFGGWAIDLHPSEGVYSKESGCQQWHSKGVFQIPYRSMYSRNITNLFLAGRIISASHIAFGSTRVMATCAHGGQAVALAAALCKANGLKPRDVTKPALMQQLQRDLIRSGQYIPAVTLSDGDDLVKRAAISASSELCLGELQPNGETQLLNDAWAMMLPVKAGPMPSVGLLVDVLKSTTLRVELRISSRQTNHTPDETIAVQEIKLSAGKNQAAVFTFGTKVPHACYVFVCLMANDDVAVHLSEQRVTGVLAVAQKFNRAVAKSPKQMPPPGSGIDSFEYWLPQRRPGGKNFALKIDPPLEVFPASNLGNGIARPTNQPNAWVADFKAEQPSVTLSWPEPQTIGRIELSFDTDFDHPMESVLMGHPENTMPFCVPNVTVLNGAKALAGVPAGSSGSGKGTEHFLQQWSAGNGSNGSNGGGSPILARLENNHQTRRTIKLDEPVETDRLILQLTAPSGPVPAALFEVRCYAD